MFTFVIFIQHIFQINSARRTSANLFFSLVYKTVSLDNASQVKRLKFKETAQKWIKTSIEDPIVKILTKNSNLTKTQLETLLIDILAENIAEKELKYDEKAKLRLLRDGVSRGAFIRTLRQAKKNVIEAIYTVLLLGYLGVFENTQLDAYLEVANKLQTYMKAYRDITEGQKLTEEHLRIIKVLHDELEAGLERLSRPWTSSTKL